MEDDTYGFQTSRLDGRSLAAFLANIPRGWVRHVGAVQRDGAGVGGHMALMYEAPSDVLAREAGPAASTRWLLLLGILLSSIGSGISQIGCSPIIGEIAQTYGVNLGTASFAVLGMMIFVMAIGVPVSGYLVDRLGVLNVLLTAQIAFIASNLLVPFVAESFGGFVALRLLLGSAAAAVAGSVTPAIARSFPPREIGRAMGLQGIGMPVGMLVGLLIVPRLVTAVGSWPIALGFLSGFGVLALLPTTMVALRTRRFAEDRLAPSERVPLGNVVRLPVFRYGIVVSILLFMTGFTFNDLAPGYLAVPAPVGLGMGAVRAGNLVSLIMLTGLFAPALAGFLVDRVFAGNPKRVMVIGWAFSLLPPLVILPLVHQSSQAVMALFILGGFAQPTVSITLMSTAARIFPSAVVGRVAGVWLSVSFFAAAFGTMMGSFGLHYSGSYILPISAIFVINVLGLLHTMLSASPSSAPRENRR